MMVDRRRKWRAQNQDIWIKDTLSKNEYVVNGNRGIDYNVNMEKPHCTCPDWQDRTPDGGCKHIIHVRIETGISDPLISPRTATSPSKVNNERGYSPKWNTLSLKTKRRDDWECQKCGAKGGTSGSAQLEAHHIKPKSKGGKDRLENLITLCHSCHEKEHGHSIPNGGSIKSSQSMGGNGGGDISSKPSPKETESRREPKENHSSEGSQSQSKTKKPQTDVLSSSLNDKGSSSINNSISVHPIPNDIKSDNYKTLVSRSRDLGISLLFSGILGSVTGVIFGSLIAFTTFLVLLPLSYFIVRNESKNVEEKVEKIEDKNREIEKSLRKINSKENAGKKAKKEDLDQMEDLLSQLDTIMTHQVERCLNEEYISWVKNSKHEFD